MTLNSESIKTQIKKHTTFNLPTLMRLFVSIFFLINTFNLISQDKSSPINGAYSGDLRKQVNISGTLVMGRITSKPPLNERGIKNVAIITKPEKGGFIQKVGITIFENTKDNLNLNSLFPENLLDSIFKMNLSDGGKIEIVTLPHEIANKLSRDFKVRRIPKHTESYSILSEINSQVDALIFLTERPLPDFFTGSKVKLGSKGVYKGVRKEAYVYSGFAISIIGTKDGKEVKGGGYTQASAEYLPFNFEKSHSGFSDEQIKIISDLLIERCENNVEQCLKMFKIN